LPIVRIDMLEGRNSEQISQMILDVTTAVANNLQIAPEKVRVLITEIPPSHWAVGGVSLSLNK